MVVDSGADMSSVHPDYVSKVHYSVDHTTIKMADGTPRKCPLAMVWFHLGESSVQKVVLVFSIGRGDALLDMELNMHTFLIQLHEHQQVKEDPPALSDLQEYKQPRKQNRRSWMMKPLLTLVRIP